MVYPVPFDGDDSFDSPGEALRVPESIACKLHYRLGVDPAGFNYPGGLVLYLRKDPASQQVYLVAEMVAIVARFHFLAGGSAQGNRSYGQCER